METHSDAVMWGTVEISYQYHFSRRKTISISVHPDLSVTVKAPQGTSLDTIRAFVRRRGSWISRAWRDFEQYLPKQPPRRYVSGETHRYLGRQYRLKVETGETNYVKCLLGYLQVVVDEEPTADKIKMLLESWYRRHAKIIFRERLLACHQKAAKAGIPLPTFVIRRMASRWGSLSSKGRITLNLLLMGAPKECIDYVILHELCHFKVRCHGTRFWALLERFMPDYEEQRRKLNMFAE